MPVTNFFMRNARVLGALMMREVITRFGREGFGFLWLIGEPLIFTFGVLLMWSIIKPAYEHGIRLGPFVMTGYMSLLLFRHQIGYAMSAIQANAGLLHHRKIHPLHVYFSRIILEFMGGTAAFFVVYVFMMAVGEVGLPKNWALLYGGWMILGFMSGGLAMCLAALSLRWDIMERLVPVLSYALIPLSGAFFMVDWLPPRFQEMYLMVPLPHGIEMVRAGVFGEFVRTHYHVTYAVAWCAIFNFLAMILLADVKDRVDPE